MWWGSPGTTTRAMRAILAELPPPPQVENPSIRGHDTTDYVSCPRITGSAAHAVGDEVGEGGELAEVGVVLLLARDRRDRDVAVVVARVEADLVGQLRDAPQALEHLLRVAAREIAAAAGVHEDGIAREQRLLRVPAGRARRMPRGMHR